MFKEDETKSLENHSKDTLLYFCRLYVDNYGFNLNPNYENF
ncbi:hypothetical protein [Thomasclavelia cocleata]|nr:hypothetical protein [Thomasclavelia cocleata]